eukprot:1012894-Pleurochrysis_carterae.AAC.2
MSATLDASLFSAYFDGCPVLNIPGRTFPITDFFVEDAIEQTAFVARGKILLKGKQAEEELAPLGGPSSPATASGVPKIAKVPEVPGLQGSDVPTYSEQTKQSLLRLAPGSVPVDLVAAILNHLDAVAAGESATISTAIAAPAASARGAVLIFLPGVREIRDLARDLARCAGSGKWLLLPLHGELPAKEQRKVFLPPPKGVSATEFALFWTISTFALSFEPCRRSGLLERYCDVSVFRNTD